MFESAELGHKIDKGTFDAEEPGLRAALLDVQFDLAEAGTFPVIILVGGVDGAGKGDTVNLLTAWMDPRHIVVNGMGAPTEEERLRPPMWRFWHVLPPKGKIGVFFGSWYTQPILDRVLNDAPQDHLDTAIERIVRFEQMLADEGALLIKFWFHLSKEVQRKRLKRLEKDKATRWRVTVQDWQRFKLYDSFRRVSAHTLRLTSTGVAPWIVVEGADARYRNLTVGRHLLQSLRSRLDGSPHVAKTVHTPPLLPNIDGRNVLTALDQSAAPSKADYDKRLERLQGRLSELSRHKRFGKHAVVLVFEGNDAAGKGGAIRRVTGALDARHYRIVPVAAPTDEERAQPYLWRFWRRIPRRGGITIFDRSWYGRVLVERVEGYCSEADWMRAYAEINDFEQQLSDGGVIVMKFWLAITDEEQLQRFKERENIQFKRFKLTEEDWRNREKWSLYERAVCDMVDRTSTEIAPWTLVAANSKYHARLTVLETICDRLDAALKK